MTLEARTPLASDKARRLVLHELLQIPTIAVNESNSIPNRTQYREHLFLDFNFHLTRYTLHLHLPTRFSVISTLRQPVFKFIDLIARPANDTFSAPNPQEQLLLYLKSKQPFSSRISLKLMHAFKKSD